MARAEEAEVAGRGELGEVRITGGGEAQAGR
jgi:hypothetical protein